ncbi:MAG: VWA domain-containing protein [Clostridia bacterium]|nr:VWA domain-containing protein [Clostridia bacterium]
MMIGKKILAIFLTFIFMVGTISIGTDTASAGVVKKIDRSYDIAVVFDNSGSMYNNTDAWCKAKYAMEVFAAMMPYKKNDSLRIYPMWEVGNKGDKEGTFKPMEISSVDDIQKIHDMYTIHNGQTPFAPAREAYEDLGKSKADEKWLIVLTDGAFNMDGRDGEVKDGIVDVQKVLSEYASDDIKVQYLGLGEEATSITPNEGNNLFATKASNSSISKDLINICNRIFHRAQLPEKYFADNGKLDLEMSMNNVIVFAQGKGAKVKGLEGTKGEVDVIESHKCQFSDVSTGGKYEDVAVVDKSLYGQIVRFGSCKKGKYKLDLKNVKHKNVQIFYEPDVNIKVTLKDPSKNDDKGKELTNADAFKAGKYNIDYNLIDNKTGKDVSNSKLLGKVTYKGALVYSDGHEKELKQGDPFVLEPDGEVFVKVSARYLDDYVISTDASDAMRDAYTIKVNTKKAKKLKVKADVLEGGNWYYTKKHDDWKPIRANLELGGNKMTDDQLDNVKIDCVFDSKGNKDVAYRVEPVSGESAVDIYLGQDENGNYIEPEKGKYKATINAAYTEKLHDPSKNSDKTKFQISGIPKILWYLERIIPLLILLLLLLWLLLHKAFPKKVYFNDKRGASKIKVKSKAVNLSSNAYPSEITCDAEKVTRFVGKGKKSAKFAIKNINPDPAVQSFSIGVGKEFVRDGTGQFVDTFGTPLSNKTKLTIRNGTEITWRKAGKKRTGTITINSKKK